MLTDSLTVKSGSIFEISGLWSAHLLRINQKAFDRFELVFDDYETAMLIDVDTRGFNRTPLEGAHQNIDSLTLKPGDCITVPGLHERVVGSAVELRAGRVQLLLEKKYAAPVTVDVVNPDAVEPAGFDWKRLARNVAAQSTADSLREASAERERGRFHTPSAGGDDASLK